MSDSNPNESDAPEIVRGPEDASEEVDVLYEQPEIDDLEAADEVALEEAAAAAAAAAAAVGDEELPPGVASAIEHLRNDDSCQGFFEHDEPVFTLAASPVAGSTVAASGGGDDDAYVFDCATGERLRSLESHGESVVASGFSSDGRLLATGALNGEVRVFSLEPWAGRTHLLETQAESVEWLQWHPRGPVLAAGLDDGTVYMWNGESGKTMQVFGGHVGSAMCGTFSADGRVLVTGGEDCSIFVWEPRTGRAAHHLQGREFHQGPVTCVAAHPDPAQPLVLSGSADATAVLSHTGGGRVLQTLREHTEAVEGVGFCRQQPWCATGSVDGRAIVWDVRTGQQRSVFRHDASGPDGEHAVTQLRWHPDAPLLFTASMDKTVRVWDARTSEPVRVWKGHKEGVLCMALADGGRRVLTGSDDSCVLVWDAAAAVP